ncbi:MAG: DUF2169 domain-containing protein [Isosphaeraceae bacterium]
MWALDNRTPFAAERTWVRDQNGAEIWIVAVKGTFRIKPDGKVEMSDDQAPIERVPKYRGEPGKSSMLYESDLVQTKPTTDILLHGCAHAPNGKPASQVDVTLKVDDLTKTLRVFGDRTWKSGVLGVSMTSTEPFVQMPITYEKAFGGVDQKSDNPKNQGTERRNPVGTGFAVEAEHLVDQKVPNVEDPRSLITSWKHRPRPAGFGPIARDWSPRVELAGTYEEKWEKERLPLPPEDFNERFFQCAPQDQQTQQYLKGGELVELKNMTPAGSLRFCLPRVALGFETMFSRGQLVRHRCTLHTVILEPDRSRVLMVWHSMLPCHSKVYKLQRTTVLRKSVLQPIGGTSTMRRSW